LLKTSKGFVFFFKKKQKRLKHINSHPLFSILTFLLHSFFRQLSQKTLMDLAISPFNSLAKIKRLDPNKFTTLTISNQFLLQIQKLLCPLSITTNVCPNLCRKCGSKNHTTTQHKAPVARCTVCKSAGHTTRAHHSLGYLDNGSAPWERRKTINKKSKKTAAKAKKRKS
jgi:predicted Zn-ribbon and HTH transcriptional regulator